MNPIKVSKAQEQANFCNIFGNSRRVQIIWTLGKHEMKVSEISEEIDASLQNTSQHLRLMRNKGVLQSRREGREIYYRVEESLLRKNCPVMKAALQKENVI